MKPKTLRYLLDVMNILLSYASRMTLLCTIPGRPEKIVLCSVAQMKSEKICA